MANPLTDKNPLTVRVEGRAVAVSGGQTILNALRRSGWPDLTGCGCRLGDCGECKITIRRPGHSVPDRVLACVVDIEDGMEILDMPFRWTRAFRFARSGA